MLKDMRSFDISYGIGALSFDRVVYYLRASVSLIPFLVCKNLDLDDVKRTNITLHFAYRTVRHALGV